MYTVLDHAEVVDVTVHHAHRSHTHTYIGFPLDACRELALADALYDGPCHIIDIDVREAYIEVVQDIEYVNNGGSNEAR